MDNVVIQVEGMSCSHCANAVSNLIKDVEGVSECEVDLENAQAKVQVNGGLTTRQDLVKAINDSEIYSAK